MLKPTIESVCESYMTESIKLIQLYRPTYVTPNLTFTRSDMKWFSVSSRTRCFAPDPLMKFPVKSRVVTA